MEIVDYTTLIPFFYANPKNESLFAYIKNNSDVNNNNNNNNNNNITTVFLTTTT